MASRRWRSTIRRTDPTREPRRARDDLGEAESHYLRALEVGEAAGFLDTKVDVSKARKALQALGPHDLQNGTR